MSTSAIKVKICGLRNASAARSAIEAGADALGFILAPSRRQVLPEEISTILQDLARSCTDIPPTVGVVVNATPQHIAEHVATSGIDMIQISGDEQPEILDEIDVPVIKMLRIASGVEIDAVKRELTRWLDRSKPVERIIIEGHVAGSYGGTGTMADWGLVAAVVEEFPLWLAGGLTPGNVAEAIAAVRPLGVDVSSGVEIDGVKDHQQIQRFVANAQMSSR